MAKKKEVSPVIVYKQNVKQDPLKERIVNFFRTDRSFSAGVQIYQGLSNAKAGFKKLLNLQAENKELKETLFHELREAAGITLKEFNILMMNPVKPVVSAPAPPQVEETLTVVKQIQQIPIGVRKSIRLREEFPFLKEKDCPPIFKILVADMLTEHDAYVNAHEDLFTADNEEAILQAARDTVENYLDNREIWDELNHYKEHGDFLGAHPEFARSERFADLMKMTVVDLVKREASLKKQITNYQGKIKKGDKPAKKKEWTDKVKEFNEELAEITRY